MKHNYVAKHNKQRAATHQDRKNDYDRKDIDKNHWDDWLTEDYKYDQIDQDIEDRLLIELIQDKLK